MCLPLRTLLNQDTKDTDNFTAWSSSFYSNGNSLYIRTVDFSQCPRTDLNKKGSYLDQRLPQHESLYPIGLKLARIEISHTANILLVKKATFQCLLFPVYFQCIFHYVLRVLKTSLWDSRCQTYVFKTKIS